jgi:flagellar basal body rod protein FlgG
MGIGDISYSAVASLKSIDTWIANINSNMAGSGRVAFKATRIKFDGGATSNERPIVSPRLGVNIAEQSVGVIQSAVDFAQGAITASTDPTHLGIQQTGTVVPMFRLVQPEFVSNTGVVTPGSQILYSRDGEFHLSENGFLVNSQGLVLLNSAGAAFGSATTLPNVDIVNGQVALNRVGISNFTNANMQLQFSRFGSTVFELVTGITDPGAETVTAEGTINEGANPVGRVIPNSLEASNSSLTQAVPELALAQKMFSAISKVIQVVQSNIDVCLGLIR